ncbi:MAG: PspC domain-containing protein [Calditrichaeota bacterium]|nr:PspC domain-containing protein [Calditrichota bacterium]
MHQETDEKSKHAGPARLYRSHSEKIIGGVCGGLADRLNIDPVLIRIGWVVFTLATNLVIGAIVYIVWMIAIPETPPQPKPTETAAAPPKKPRARRVKKIPEQKESKDTTDSKSKQEGKE